MNKKLITLIIAFGLTTIVSAETIHTTVNGMVCAFCATGIEKTFRKQPEVESVNFRHCQEPSRIDGPNPEF